MNDETYLDHAGATLPPRELLESVFSGMLDSTGLKAGGGNPHSSREAEARISDARALILHHFGASHEEYDVVFNSGTTAGLKTVGELFPFGAGGSFVYPANVHTSALGIRGYAPQSVCFPSDILYCISEQCESEEGDYSESEGTMVEEETESSFDLLTVSGECNFSGAKADLRIVQSMVNCINGRERRDPGNVAARLRESAWVVGESDIERISWKSKRPLLWLLDAAKLAGSTKIDLSQYKPDFVTISFYKMFGYPTGLGCLLVKRKHASLLRERKRYYGGGVVDGVAATANFRVLRTAGTKDAKDQGAAHEWLEDGTLHYQGINALRNCYDALIPFGGIQGIGSNASLLRRALVKDLLELKHGNGISLVEVYGYEDEHKVAEKADGSESDENYTARQGGTVSFSLQAADGAPIGYAEVYRMASINRIILRAGCFCNIGACQEALGLSSVEVRRAVTQGRSCWEDNDGSDLLAPSPSDGRDSESELVKHTGAIRASLGLGSTREDCNALVEFLKRVFIDLPANVRLQPDSASCAPSSTSNISLQSLHLYPIKSCAGLSVRRWPLVPGRGLLLDREWVVSDKAGRALTLKSHPLLALVQPTVDLVSNQLVLTVDSSANSSVKKMEPLSLKLGRAGIILRTSEARVEETDTCVQPSSASAQTNKQTLQNQQASEAEDSTVRICGKPRQAVHCSVDAATWFSDLLGLPCTLLRADDTPMSKAKLKDNTELTQSFANEAQLLMVTAESVDSLRELMKASTEVRPFTGNDASIFSPAPLVPVTTANFRPNMVLTGTSEGLVAHEEDDWVSLVLGGTATVGASTNVRLLVTKPCARCSVVNVDGRTGEMTGKVLAALVGNRKNKGAIHFGQFLCPVFEETEIQNNLIVLETGSKVIVEKRI